MYKSWLFREAILFIIKLLDFVICPASSSVLRKSLNLFTTWQKLLECTPVNIIFLFDEILSAFCFRMTSEAFRCSDSHMKLFSFQCLCLWFMDSSGAFDHDQSQAQRKGRAANKQCAQKSTSGPPLTSDSMRLSHPCALLSQWQSWSLPTFCILSPSFIPPAAPYLKSGIQALNFISSLY